MISATQQAPPKRRRESLGLKVTSEIKLLIESAARASGRTQSQEAEYRIELAFKYERMMGEFERWQEALRKQQREIERNNLEAERGTLEAVLHRKGWQKLHNTKTGRVSWIPPDQRPFPQSGFIPDERETTVMTKPEQKTPAQDPRVMAALSALMDALTTPTTKEDPS